MDALRRRMVSDFIQWNYVMLKIYEYSLDLVQIINYFF